MSGGVVRLLEVEPTPEQRYGHALDILRRAEAAEAAKLAVRSALEKGA